MLTEQISNLFRINEHISNKIRIYIFETMLQIIDQARLDAVLKAKETYQNTYKRKLSQVIISKEIGIGTSTVSEYLSGQKPISENFYRTFMEKYGSGQKEEKIFVTDSTINKTDTQVESLIRQNEQLTLAHRELTQANKDLAHTNRDLAANLLELTKMINSNDLKEKISTASTIRSEVLELLAPIVKDSLGLEYPTNSKALLELDRRLGEIEKKKKVKGSHSL